GSRPVHLSQRRLHPEETPVGRGSSPASAAVGASEFLAFRVRARGRRGYLVLDAPGADQIGDVLAPVFSLLAKLLIARVARSNSSRRSRRRRMPTSRLRRP